MNFVIVRSENAMSIDNARITFDMSALPANIEVIAWDGKTGAGNTEYNDRLRILEPFDDPSGYQWLINRWIEVAAVARPPEQDVTAAERAALTLPQAKVIKNGFVDGIYNCRRQTPASVFGLWWHATDDSLAAMMAAVTAWDVGGAVNGIQLISTSTSTSNTGTNFSHGLSGITGMSGTPAGLQILAIPSGVGVGGFVVNATTTTSTSTDTSKTSIYGPTINWIPMGLTTQIGLSTVEMRQLIGAIEQRRAVLQHMRLQHQAWINAINDPNGIQQIINHDATWGWP